GARDARDALDRQPAEEEAGGLSVARRFDSGAAARELRRDLGLDGQADDAAQAAVLQRVVLRIQVLLRAPRGRRAPRPDHDEEGSQERRIRGFLAALPDPPPNGATPAGPPSRRAPKSPRRPEGSRNSR